MILNKLVGENTQGQFFTLPLYLAISTSTFQLCPVSWFSGLP